MKEQDMGKYIDLVERRRQIAEQNEAGQNPEYAREIEEIDQELEAVRKRVDLEAKLRNELNELAAASRIPRMMTIKAASLQTGLSYDYIRKLCAQGKIIYIRAGSKFLVNLDRLIEYLNVGDAGAGQ